MDGTRAQTQRRARRAWAHLLDKIHLVHTIMTPRRHVRRFTQEFKILAVGRLNKMNTAFLKVVPHQSRLASEMRELFGTRLEALCARFMDFLESGVDVQGPLGGFDDQCFSRYVTIGLTFGRAISLIVDNTAVANNAAEARVYFWRDIIYRGGALDQFRSHFDVIECNRPLQPSGWIVVEHPYFAVNYIEHARQRNRVQRNR